MIPIAAAQRHVPLPYRPQPGAVVSRPKSCMPPLVQLASRPLLGSPAGFRPGVVQAKFTSSQQKYYPNLNPSAAVPVKKSEIFTLHDFFGNYRLKRGGEHGQYVPNMKYIFVRTADGETLLHPRHRHPAIASGKPVLYAGEAYFNNGTLEWWSNGSGNYRPDAGHAEQAELPMERFYSFDQILKGVHKRSEGSQSRPASSQNGVFG